MFTSFIANFYSIKRETKLMISLFAIFSLFFQTPDTQASKISQKVKNVSKIINFIEFDSFRTDNRLDFSSTYQFNFSKKNKLKAKIGLSIKNIYNQKNHLSKEYSGFNNVDDPITVQNRYSLGFMPNFLFKVYF